MSASIEKEVRDLIQAQLSNAGPPLKRQKNTRITHVGAISACDTAGQFVDLSHLRSAGLDEIDNRRLFVRAEWAKLWKNLTGTKNLFLTGPPGTGK